MTESETERKEEEKKLQGCKIGSTNCPVWVIECQYCVRYDVIQNPALLIKLTFVSVSGWLWA